ncbi:Alpha/Beta hydrolase protein [Cokeromyces recurvatus]|uniref:Alpha/Beta hydrolase protein n=1 Tax=Cokeromyces recurvatus TaxID=90255 RepID=UPI00221E3B33|nr:Alpha/Beta hydrolase protein [Cokeromyces recurvatus]KAI7904032.1 Alpha/Beta hydrolase protein [Cokeromyces recurvatus]
MLSAVEQWFCVTFPQGLNPNLECIRLNLDPVQAVHRPFILYLSMYLITTVFHLFYLKNWGFQHSGGTEAGIIWGGPIGYLHDVLQSLFTQTTKESQMKRLSYYYRPSTSISSDPQTPIVFIHGIGVGILCYAEFIYQVVTQLDRPIFLVELPYVAMHMVDSVPTAIETVSEISNMLNEFGYDKAVYISHSLGTGVTSWVMNMAPETVAGLILIDPICFLLHHHHVAFNFVHRLPKTIFEYILHYGAARELYISYYISRHFQWYETIYFCKEVDSVSTNILENASIFLSENDGIVGSTHVHHYLSKRGAQVHMMEGLRHAMFLTNTEWKNKILNQIDFISRKADVSNK